MFNTILKYGVYPQKWQSVPLATSPKPLSSKYSFGLVKISQIQYIL